MKAMLKTELNCSRSHSQVWRCWLQLCFSGEANSFYIFSPVPLHWSHFVPGRVRGRRPSLQVVVDLEWFGVLCWNGSKATEARRQNEVNKFSFSLLSRSLRVARPPQISSYILHHFALTPSNGLVATHHRSSLQHALLEILLLATCLSCDWRFFLFRRFWW